MLAAHGLRIVLRISEGPANLSQAVCWRGTHVILWGARHRRISSQGRGAVQRRDRPRTRARLV